MKNIEKYQDGIRSELEKATSYERGKMTIGCATKKSREGNCNDEFDCNTCCLKSFNWLLEEYEPSILTDEEKIIIKNILNSFEPFGKEVSYITKERWDYGKNCCFLNFHYGDEGVGTLSFNADELFKGMEINKACTPEELGL